VSTTAFFCIRTSQVSVTSVPYRPDPRTHLGIHIAEASLTSGQIQELADKIGESTKAAVGHDLRISLRVELHGGECAGRGGGKGE